MKLNQFKIHGALPVALCVSLFAAGRADAQTTGQAFSATRPLRADAAGTPGAATRRLPKRIVLLRAGGDANDGSRVTISSDSPLDDFDSYREGNSFYVRIPWAAAVSRQLNAEGRFYTSARVEERGDAVLVTFDLRESASANLAKGFNRLDVIFTGSSAGSKADASRPAPVSNAVAAGASEEAATIREMREQIAALEARVRELEAKQAAQPAPPAARDASVTAAAQPSADVAARGAEGTPTIKTDTNAAHGASAQHGAHDAHDIGHGGTPQLQVQGFADVDLRASNEKGSHTSFALGQLDLFITSRLSEKFGVLGELIVDANERNQFSFEIHRLLLQYTPNDYLQLGVGRYHTGIGYYNTAYHHGSWFQTAADRPFIFAFESKGGILPLHNVGLQATGRVPGAPWGLHYVAEVGNGRASRTPSDQPVQTAVDENNRKAFNLGLFARPRSVPGLQTGFSFYRDILTPLGAPKVGQTISAGYFVYQNARYESLNEVVLMRLTSRGRVFNTPAFYTQLARQFGNLRPFFRYQYINVPRDNPYFGDVGRRNGPAFGVRYDLTDFAAFKAQYEHTSRRDRSALDQLLMQLAFTF
jgi:hypothetical protein